MSNNNTNNTRKEVSEKQKNQTRYLIDVILYGTATVAFLIAFLFGLKNGTDQITTWSFGCCVLFLLVLTLTFVVKYLKAKK